MGCIALAFQEAAQRSKALVLLKTNLGEIDGTIKPPFSHFSKSAQTPAEHLEAFGMEFYQVCMRWSVTILTRPSLGPPPLPPWNSSRSERSSCASDFLALLLLQELFSLAPELKDTLFKDKRPELLAMKFGAILGELIRLLEIPNPSALAGVIAEMALRHVEYGLQPDHAVPFRNAMVATVKKVVKKKGHKWSKKNQSAWNWALNEITGMLVEATVAARPRVTNLKK